MKLLGLRIEKAGKYSIPEKRTAYSIDDIRLLSELFPNLNTNSKSGVNVTQDNAMGLAAVFSSVRVISEDLASMPMEVIRKATNKREKDTNYFLYDLIHNNPNHYQTAFTFYDSLTAMANLWGNAFALIHRDYNGRAVEFELIHSSKVAFYLLDRKMWYTISGYSKVFPASEIIHVSGPSYDGIAGVSMLRLHRETIGGAIAARDFGNTFFKNGANLNGVLTSDQRLDDPQIKRYEDGWNKKHTGGAEKNHKTAVLGSGLKYQAIGVPPEDAQFISTKKMDRSEIAGIYRVSAHKINDLEKATFSNIEHLGIEHVNNAIRPWAKRIEQEFKRKLVPQADQSIITLKFNLMALMRGDAKSRMEYYRGMQAVGALNANEIRTLENINVYDDGNTYFVPLNYAPMDKVEALFDAKIEALNTKTKSI